jgi:hypothetical protein
MSPGPVPSCPQCKGDMVSQKQRYKVLGVVMIVVVGTAAVGGLICFGHGLVLGGLSCLTFCVVWVPALIRLRKLDPWFCRTCGIREFRPLAAKETPR